MKQTLIPAFAIGAAAVGLASATFAAGPFLPGDNGRSGTGIAAPNAPQNPVTPLAPIARPGVELAFEAAKAIADGCKQYPLGVAVVNAAGQPILTYIPDRSNTGHTYTAIRKAYSAITLKANTAQITARSQTDPEYAAQFSADPNLTSNGGGVLLKVGDRIVGAIGVSGAEPGHHDDECAQFGLAKIKDRLK